MAPYATREIVEAFWILPLDTQHRLIGGGPTIISRGLLNSSLVHPREVFSAAIVAMSVAIILVHNHPSGDPTPSQADIQMTKAIVDIASPLGIAVHDHIIVGKNGHASLKALRLI